jgi:hypothetical protein
LPAISQLTFPVVIARAGLGGHSAYTVTPEDFTILVEEMPPGGLTIRLPGVSSHVPPCDGDFFVVADPQGLISEEDALAIDGDGHPILESPVLILTKPYAWAALQFDERSKLWIPFVGGLPRSVHELHVKRRLAGESSGR